MQEFYLVKLYSEKFESCANEVTFHVKNLPHKHLSENSETSIAERLTKGWCPPKGTSLVGELRKVFVIVRPTFFTIMINNAKVKNMDVIE